MGFEVQLINLTKKFGEILAVDNFSLDVSKGEFVSLLGPSGCGKTTTLRMIAGLTHEDDGNILIRGEDVFDIPPYKRNIGLVFQDYALFPHMTVRDNIAFGLRMRSYQREASNVRVQELLDLVRLPGIGNRFPDQLSGGQQQRIALARALAPHPSVLLLDEPLSNLDLKLRQEMRIEIKRIQKETGVTAIFVTHDQSEALSLSDRVVIMRSGRVLQIGRPIDLYEHPQTEFVASFLGDANFFRGIVKDGRLISDGVEIMSEELREYHLQQLTVIIRSERISISTKDISGPNTTTGIVDDPIYLGGVTRYYVHLAEGRQVVVDTTKSGAEPYTQGEKVTLNWSTSACVPIRETVPGE